MGYGRFWGTHGSSHRFDHAGWHIEVGSFTYSAPADWSGKVSWQYRMSRNRIVPGVWRNKNPRGRKFETRCFTSRAEAEAAARCAAISAST